jgi:protocatechuate 3,4-dioxygenase beta subunit
MVLLLAASLAMAQTDGNNRPANNPPTASVSGMVRDKVSKQPLANYIVSTSGNRQITTDASGKYTLTNLPPGRYGIEAQGAERFLPQVKRMVAVAGQDLESIDLDVPMDGIISGRVLDENREPVPGAWVHLISHEYYLGTAGYFYTSVLGHADDQGQYLLAQVPAGRPYLLLASQAATSIPAHSAAPLNPKFRKPATVRTWYPNSPDREGAVPVVLGYGEHREGTDIEMKRSPNYCVEGVTTGPNGPMAMRFQIEALQPSSGSTSTGGAYVMAPNGITGADGKLRICDLTPGTYRVQIATPNSHGETLTNLGVTDVVVKDEDLRGIKFVASPGQTLEAEVVWDTPPPGAPPSVKLSLHLQPTLRTGNPGTADWEAKDTDVPGDLLFQNLFLDDYAVQPTVKGKGLYVKDVTYAGRSVRYEPLRYGSAMQGSGLRVVVARDGGTIAAVVADKDGNPVADARVALFAADAGSEGLAAATMVTGQTDQLGRYASKTLAPGIYYVVASEEEFDASLESVGKLWRSRTTLQQVELAPNGSAHVNLQPAKLM